MAKFLKQSDRQSGRARAKETREKESRTHTGSHSFFLLQAPLQDRQISFGASSRCIWRLLCLSLPLSACLTPSPSFILSLSLSLFFSLFFSLSWLFWLVNYFIQHICWIDAWIIHQLHVATIISCYFYLPGSLCSAKQFKVLLARFLRQSGRCVWRGVGVVWRDGREGREKGKNKYKTLTILTTINKSKKIYISNRLSLTLAGAHVPQDWALPEEHSYFWLLKMRNIIIWWMGVCSYWTEHQSERPGRSRWTFHVWQMFDVFTVEHILWITFC